MKKVFLISLLLAMMSWAVPHDALAMMHGPGRQMGPYGGYCKGPRWGWYGARRQVRTEAEVKDLVSEFLSGTGYKAGEIRDRDTYFEVDIMDEEGERADLLIVDKRSCRIRSAY